MSKSAQALQALPAGTYSWAQAVLHLRRAHPEWKAQTIGQCLKWLVRFKKISRFLSPDRVWFVVVPVAAGGGEA